MHLHKLSWHNNALQQKVSLYVKWFHWILSEFGDCNEPRLMKSNEFIDLMNNESIDYNEPRLVKKQWIHWSNE
jgi:hypothetical protein